MTFVAHHTGKVAIHKKSFGKHHVLLTRTILITRSVLTEIFASASPKALPVGTQNRVPATSFIKKNRGLAQNIAVFKTKRKRRKKEEKRRIPEHLSLLPSPHKSKPVQVRFAETHNPLLQRCALLLQADHKKFTGKNLFGLHKND